MQFTRNDGPKIEPSSCEPRPSRRLVAVSSHVAVLGVLLALAFVHQAVAKVSERQLVLGDDLPGFGALVGHTTGVTLNGQRLVVSTRVVPQPLDAVLARFVDLCSEDGGALASEMARQLGATHDGTAGVIERMFVLRDELDDGSALAVCFAGLAEGGLDALIGRLERFAHSRDLAELGRLRYVRLRPTGGGTHAVLVGADGPLRLDELVPPPGQDAIGSEIVQGVRPASSTRYLSARAARTPHHFTAYRSTARPAEAFDDYRRQLERTGYEPLAPGQGGAELAPYLSQQGAFAGIFRRGEDVLMVTSTERADGSSMSVLKLQEAPDPQAR